MRFAAHAVGAIAGAVVMMVAGGVGASGALAHDLSCNRDQVDAGAAFRCVVTGDDGAEATLVVTTSTEDASVAGAVSLTSTIVDGRASFTATAPQGDVDMVVSALVDGEAVGTAQMIHATSRTGSSGDPRLNVPLAMTALGLLIAGGAAVYASTVRRGASNRELMRVGIPAT